MLHLRHEIGATTDTDRAHPSTTTWQRLVSGGVRGGLQPTSRSTAPSAGAVESPSLVPKLPCFSLTTVYRESIERYRGQYHQHSYGELHLVVHWATRLLGARGWCGAGWTAPNLAVITIPRPRAAPCHRLPGSRGGTVSGCPGVHVAVIRCRRAAVRSCTRPGDLGENPVQQHVTGMGGPECTGRPGDGCAQTTGHRVDPGISGIPADPQAGRELPQCVVLTGAVNARREGRGPTMPITFTLTPPTT